MLGFLFLSTACAASPTDLQARINAARPGDTIVLPAGSVYTGNFVLPSKSGSGTITITSAEAAALPEGVRVKPSDRIHMAALRSTNQSPVIDVAPGAHNYRLVGLEVYSDGAYNYGVIQLGAVETSPDQLPRDIELDRLYIHGDSKVGSKRGVALNGISLSVRNCYISDFKGMGQDTQAIAGWGGPGPFAIVNNYLEGAGENVIFGGATPRIREIVPSDIEIRGNYFYKPLAWKRDDPSYAGTAWEVKNLLELKSARRVRIIGNIFENCWPHAQSGYAMVLTVRTQGSTAPWSVVEDVLFENNVIRNAESGLIASGRDDDGTGRTQGITVRNNLWLLKGHLFELLNGTGRVTMEHNTAVHGGCVLRFDGKPPSEAMVFRNNICFHNAYGVVGSGIGGGTVALEHYTPGAVFQKNVIVGADGNHYPANNFYPAKAEFLFRDPVRQLYGLAENSPYRRAGTDELDIGANIERILHATAGAISGKW
jgi:hypothetical protein